MIEDLPPSSPNSYLGRMRRESARLSSFTNFDSQYIKPEQMARAGFFYSGSLDRVQCPYCKGVLGNWEPGDVPLEEHRRNFPYCPFLLEYDDNNSDTEETNNIHNELLNPDDGIFYNAPLTLSDLCISPSKEPLEQRLYHVKNAFFTSFDSRYETFACWPHPALSTSKMAEAGFYYLGYEDYVKCFYCDGGLRNWKSHYDPWVEHAKWFSKCPFIEIVKGEKFVQEIATTQNSLENNNPSPILSNNVINARNSQNIENTINTNCNNGILPNDDIYVFTTNVNTFTTDESDKDNSSSAITTPKSTLQKAIEIEMNKSFVKSILAIGIPKDTIFNTVYHYYKCGIKFETSEALLKAISYKKINNLKNGFTINPKEHCSSTSLSQSALENNNNFNPTNTELANKQNNESATSCFEEGKNGLLTQKETEELREGGGSSPKTNKLQRLESENQLLKEQRCCKICLEREMEVVFINCGHFAVCSSCALMLNKCPICREEIRGTVRTYLS